MHVDGFRFDLATALTRQSGELDIHSAFLNLVHQDPVLAPVKMIAEPWDVAGYQLGGFPAPWSEWNGKYRDTVRDFWRGVDGTIGELGLRLTGSGDIYSSDRRTPTASINFVTAHDGFTLADVTWLITTSTMTPTARTTPTASPSNRSWNCGAEGDPPTDPDDRRPPGPPTPQPPRHPPARPPACLCSSAGMRSAAHSDGNNNACCQDNDLSWFDWVNVDQDMLAFHQDGPQVTS